MIKFRATSFVVCLALAAPTRADDPLTVGDPAPPLSLKAFMKGEPFKEFKKGTVYVVEFSGTECAPCVKAMPILSELRKTHPKVIVLSVYSEPTDAVTEYVVKNGEKMNYLVAADDEAKTEKAWMAAAVRSGIPCVFVVNAESKVAWVGSPFDMDKPLAEIVKGTYDIARERVRSQFNLAKRLQEKAAYDNLHRSNETASKAMKLFERKEYQSAITLLDRAVQENRDWEFKFLSYKLMVLANDPAAKEDAFRFVRDLYGRVAATPISTSPVIPNMAQHCTSYAFDLIHAIEGMSPANNLIAAELFLHRAEEIYGFMKDHTDSEKRNKYFTERNIKMGRVELAKARKEWANAVQYQKEFIDSLRNDKYGESYVVDWKNSQERRLKEEEAKLAEFVKARDGGK